MDLYQVPAPANRTYTWWWFDERYTGPGHDVKVALYAGLSMITVSNDVISKMLWEQTAEEERVVRELLSHWVSGVEPAVVRNRAGLVVGLCSADTQLGDTPWVLRVGDVI